MSAEQMKVFRQGPIADLGDADGGARAAFLATPRAAVVCWRELDRLSDDLAARLAAYAAAAGTPAPEIRRVPNRCIVQWGPVGLTVSWVRARVDTVANGRLLVIEWVGVVGRTFNQAPERFTAPIASSAARMLSETVLSADATSEKEWFWRNEAPPQMRYQSSDLAEHCVNALQETLRRARGR